MGGLTVTGRWLQFRRAIRASIGVTSKGFTVVEVMIVLTITGALFVAAAILINGKQNQAAFNQAIQQIQSQLQQTMNEVAAGYFPSNSSFQCTAALGGPVTLTSVGPNAQGTNAGCIFVGKVVQFQVSGTNPEKFAIFTVAGAQKDASGKEVDTLAHAAPKVIAPGVASPPGYPDITTTTILQNGLATSAYPPAGMWYNAGGADIPVGAVAFVSSFASYSGSALSSGSQQLSIVPVAGTTLGMTPAAAADAINLGLPASVSDPVNGVSICFASGGTDQSGLVTIGGNGHPLSVTLKVMQGTKTCGR